MTESIRFTRHRARVSRHPLRFFALVVIAAVTLLGIFGLALWAIGG